MLELKTMKNKFNIKKNLGFTERLVRLLLGILVIAVGLSFVEIFLKIVISIIGAYIIATALSGFCFEYKYIKE